MRSSSSVPIPRTRTSRRRAVTSKATARCLGPGSHRARRPERRPAPKPSPLRQRPAKVVRVMHRFGRALALLCLLASGGARAQQEEITDIRVLNAVRTNEETVRSIAGLSIGDTMGTDTLDVARERLHTSGMFA